MAGRGVLYGGGGDAKNQTQKLKIHSYDQPLDPIFTSVSSNSCFGLNGMVSFGAVGANKSRNSSFCSFDPEESVDEYLDEYLNQPEKKRRLSVDQVQFLERTFDADNKLEPDRKIQLAKELGVQPRQIAVWFQNRRARFKTKQLETDNETLHGNYNCLKTDYDNLLKENEKLKAEVLRLKDTTISRDIILKGNSQSCDTKELSKALPKGLINDMVSEDEESIFSAVASYKNKDLSSAISTVTDTDSPHFPIVRHSSFTESDDSSHAFEPDQSEFSPNICCQPTTNSCYFGLPVEDHGFSFWSY